MPTACAIVTCAAFALAEPPMTEVAPVTDVIHGVEVVDNYRWLEGDAEGNVTPEVAKWTDEQNRYTRSMLDNLPGRQELEERIGELMSAGSISAPTMRGNRYFYSKRDGSQEQPVVYMREGHDGVPRALLDPNQLAADGLDAIQWYTPNHDGSLLAFGKYRAGDEKATLYILDVDSGDWLAEEIPGKVRMVNWLPDSSGFFYRRQRDADNPYSGQVKFHRLGTHHSQDRVLFEQYTEGEGAKTWGPWGTIDRDGRWMMLGYNFGWSRDDLWYVDVEHFLRTGNFVWHDLIVGEEASIDPQVLNDTAYIQTNLDAPNGRVLAIDLHNPDRANWREVIPERSDAVLRSFSFAKGMIVATYGRNAYSAIERFKLDGTPIGELELPGIGTASISTNPDRTEAFVSYSSYNEPRSIYRVDLATGDRWLWERPDVPVDPSLIDVKQVTYASKDGTPVTMFLVHMKGMKLDGNNPCILYGYGGFNVSLTPNFSANRFPWLERGGMYAIANLRGGGEYGERWHRGGMLDTKQNTFDDFIAAGEWLIGQRYTNKDRLAIMGGSNGGLLVGAAVTQRPDLFKAAICAVPLLDMLRYQDFLMARYWVPEYGSSEDPEQFRFIREYSPYQNVTADTKYPAMLITAGENDSRVHPLHARKMAALMQASTSSDQEKHPILLWVDRDAGHGQGKPLNLRIRDAADTRIFLMWQLGMLDE